MSDGSDPRQSVANDDAPLLQYHKIAATKPKPRSYKRVLIVDDHSDTSLTFKVALEGGENNKEFEVYTYNDPLSALFEFKPDFYDLLLIDINLPYMNGFELYEKISKLDINVKVCFMSAGEVNHEAVREIYSTISMGCFIKKPIAIDYLLKRIKAELY